MPSTKQFINNNISIKLLGKQTKNKSKSKRKNQNRANDKKVLQSKPAFSNFQYPQPIIINPQQQKQLDENYSNKLATLMQKKFDEEYAKKENEKATQKMNRVGAFQAVDNGNGFSQPVNLLSKRNDTFERPTLQSESEQQPRINPIVQSQVRKNPVVYNPPTDYYAQPIVDGYTTDAVQGEPLNPLWHCDVCNREMQLRSKQAHLKTKGHKEKLKEQEQEQKQQEPEQQEPQQNQPIIDANKEISILKKQMGTPPQKQYVDDTMMIQSPILPINRSVPPSLLKSPAYEASLAELSTTTKRNNLIDESQFLNGNLSDLFRRSKMYDSDNLEETINPLAAYERKLKAESDRVLNSKLYATPNNKSEDQQPSIQIH